MIDNLQIEAKQVRLRLTDNKELLDEARRRGSLKKMKGGGEKFVVQFDSTVFEFTIDARGNRNNVTVGESVARALRSDSRVVIGHDMTGEFLPLIESVAIYDVTRGLPENICQFCGHDAEDKFALAAHVRDTCPKVHEFAPPKQKEATAAELGAEARRVGNEPLVRVPKAVERENASTGVR